MHHNNSDACQESIFVENQKGLNAVNANVMMEQWVGRYRSKSIKSYNLVPLLKRLYDLLRIARALSVMMLQQCRDMLLKKQKHKAHLLVSLWRRCSDTPHSGKAAYRPDCKVRTSRLGLSEKEKLYLSNAVNEWDLENPPAPSPSSFLGLASCGNLVSYSHASTHAALSWLT